METLTSSHQAQGYRRIDEDDDNSRSIRRFQFCNWCFFSVLNIINTTIYLAGFYLAVHLSDRLERFYLIGMLALALVYAVAECAWLGCTMGNMKEGYMFSKGCSIVTVALFTSLIIILAIMEQITIDQKFYIGISLLVIGMTFECIITMCSICFAETYRNMQLQRRATILDDTETMVEPLRGFSNPHYAQMQGQPGPYNPYPTEYYTPHMHAHQPMNPRVMVPAEVHAYNPATGMPIGIDHGQNVHVETRSVP
uniref:Uncharacterized protein n=2 Tax=Acrobeloides nanus TaxID=290746 RepID=A0A914BZC7_9BILA